MKKRISYNWYHIVEELDLIKDYLSYKAEHDFKMHRKGKKEISQNRLARGYILSLHDFMPKDLSWAIKLNEKPIPQEIKDSFWSKIIREVNLWK